MSVNSAKWVPGERYSASVIETASDIHSEVVGSGQLFHSEDDYTRAVAWLRWRVGDGWDATNTSEFDWCVRSLALCAVALADKAAKK